MKNLSKREWWVAILTYLLSYFGIIDLTGPIQTLGTATVI